MSKFTSSVSGFRNIGKKAQPIPITNKISQKDLKKQKKQASPNANPNRNLPNQMSDKEFERMMAEDDYDENVSKSKQTNIDTYKIPDVSNTPEQIKQLIQSKIVGKELLSEVKSSFKTNNSIGKTNNSIDLVNFLNYLLCEKTDYSDLSWLEENSYGPTLQYLSSKSNTYEQVICLGIIQTYCERMSFPKIMWKNTESYLMRVLFQTMFVNSIIEEKAYYLWEDNINEFIQDKETKLIQIVMQVSSFFLLLKNYEEEKEEDGEDGEDGEDKKLDNGENEEDDIMIKINNKLSDDDNNDEENDENDESDEDIPIEQDHNMECIEKFKSKHTFKKSYKKTKN